MAVGATWVSKMTITKISCYCNNCNKEINQEIHVCPHCKADITKEQSKTVKIELKHKLVSKHTLRIKGKNANNKIVFKHRIDADGTQHRIDVDRINSPPEAWHSVLKEGKLIHRHKK